ncbi:MAG: serine/threonine-protein kinase [Blastocatellia bacterium]
MSEMLVTNSNISHYRIVSRIGAGGMGEVYLAEDTRLDRKVALKLLPAEFTRDADRVRRFMQEARAASALNHPNIITVYDIGESEAGRFIVVELVAGRTLRRVLADDNSLETLLALGSQMAKALSAAHGAGITHRDIKPDNIMAASGEDAATIAQQTTPGMIMGTVAYMSPEQATSTGSANRFSGISFSISLMVASSSASLAPSGKTAPGSTALMESIVVDGGLILPEMTVATIRIAIESAWQRRQGSTRSESLNRQSVRRHS